MTWDPVWLDAVELLSRAHGLYGDQYVDADTGGVPTQLRRQAARIEAATGDLPATAALRRTADTDSELDALLVDARTEHSVGWHGTRRLVDEARADSMPATDTAVGHREALRRMASRLHQQRRQLRRSRQHSQLRARESRRLSYLRGAGYPARSGVLALSAVRYETLYSAGHVRQRIAAALNHLGITDPVARRRWMRGYETLIARESGGRPGAIASDPATAPGALQPDGHRMGFARGLTQTIPATFARYHQPGTSTNIYEPVANICASMNYVMRRYGVSLTGENLAAVVQQADARRPPKGY